MEQSTKRVIKLSDLPTRKFVPEEPITEELRAKMLAKSRAFEASEAVKVRDESSVHIDATMSVPIVIDAYASCDAVSFHC